MCVRETVARAGMYHLLARLWISEVDTALLQTLSTTDLHDSWTEAGGILPDGNGPETVEILAADYCQLFIGPHGHLPPYQSVWQERILDGAAAASMRKYLAAVGYSEKRLPEGIMPDHLGVQLDFMAELLGRALEDSPDRNLLMEIADNFVAQHLTWTRELTNAGERRAQTDFYQAMIRMTAEFFEAT